MQQVRRNVAHRLARTHRRRSSFRFVKIPRAESEGYSWQQVVRTPISGPSWQLCVPLVSLRGDSYRLKDRDLGRPTSTANADQ